MKFENQPKGFEDPNFGKTIENLDEAPQRRPNEFSFGEKSQIKRSQFNDGHGQQAQRTRPFVVENIDILERLESLEGQVTQYKTKFKDLKDTIEHKESELENQRISSVEKTKQQVELRLLKDGNSKADRKKKYMSVD
jgi:predicted nuclease with TOPRIM domain